MNLRNRISLCAATIILFGSLATAPASYTLIWTWGMNDHPEWCEAFKKAGFNSLVTAIPRKVMTERWWLNSASLATTDAVLAEAARTQMRAYFQIPLGMGPGTQIGRRTVTAAGFTEPLLACPLNQEFWDDYLIPAVMTIARKSLDHPALKGVILDTEQYYGKERSGAINEHYCFCDTCFGGFLKKIGTKESLPVAAGRKPWLEAAGKEADYWKYLETCAQKQVDKLVDAIKDITPNFEIHFYIYQPTWYYRGLLKGLARLGHPVLVCDERSYSGFLKGWSQEARAGVLELNPKAVWSPGFYTTALSPRMMRANVRQALETVGSYWIYNNTVPFPPDQLKALE